MLQQKFIFYWKSKVKVPAGLVSPEAFLLDLQMASHGLRPVCQCSFCLCGS
jgi:hypothetical protein